MTSSGNDQSKSPAGIPFTPPPPPATHAPSGHSSDKQDIDSEVAQALGGVSIEDLMAQSVNKGPSTPNLDPARPVRSGRPGARRIQEGGINPR